MSSFSHFSRQNLETDQNDLLGISYWLLTLLRITGPEFSRVRLGLRSIFILALYLLNSDTSWFFVCFLGVFFFFFLSSSLKASKALTLFYISDNLLGMLPRQSTQIQQYKTIASLDFRKKKFLTHIWKHVKGRLDY